LDLSEPLALQGFINEELLYYQQKKLEEKEEALESALY
jgi:hypothetical protein